MSVINVMSLQIPNDGKSIFRFSILVSTLKQDIEKLIKHVHVGF